MSRSAPFSLPDWRDLTPERLRELYQEREWSIRQIAVLYGFAESSIWKRLVTYGIPRRAPSRTLTSRRVPVDVARAVADLRRGLSLSEIALAQWVSAQTLRRRLAEAGVIPARRRGYDRGPEEASR